MSNPNTAELLFHLLASLTQCLYGVARTLAKRDEVKEKTLIPWSEISRSQGEDFLNKPVDQTDFDAEVAIVTTEGDRFSFQIQLRFQNGNWTLSADVSEIEKYGPTARAEFPEFSSTDLQEVATAADKACAWLLARAADFGFQTHEFPSDRK